MNRTGTDNEAGAPMTDYEVELKFPIQNAAPLIDRLEALGARRGSPARQVDRYFAHPSRNFAETDEALRLRTEGMLNYLTYKGPLLDAITKSRQELELPVEADEVGAQRAWALLRALGFEEVRAVRKERLPFGLQAEGRDFVVALDSVEGLGDFIEIETLAGPDDWESARDAALRLAAQLQLTESERRSYLQLLLERTPAR